METPLLMLVFNLALCLLVAAAGSNRKIGFGLSLVLCIFLTPIIGGIITMLSPKIIDKN